MVEIIVFYVEKYWMSFDKQGKSLCYHRGDIIEVLLDYQQKYVTLMKRVRFLFSACWKSSIRYHCALVTVSPALPPHCHNVHALPPPKGQRLRTPLQVHIWEGNCWGAVDQSTTPQCYVLLLIRKENLNAITAVIAYRFPWLINNVIKHYFLRSVTSNIIILYITILSI